MAIPSVKSKLFFIVILSLFATISGWIFLTIYYHQPTPYMDEEFHIPQAQKYCEGKFEEWNPKITTLPGLYLISVGVITPASYIFGRNFCDVFHLRCTNLLFSAINFYLFFCIINRLHGGNKDFSPSKAVLLALNLATFPPLYFFTFLYYTDVAACAFVLLMYLFHLHGHNIMSSFIGFLAIVMRQTNVVWVVFVAILTVYDTLISHLRFEKKEVRMDVKSTFRYCVIIGRGIVNLATHQRRRLPLLLWDLMNSCAGFCIVGIAFAVFIHVNRGVVIGDRDAHQACLHIPQFLYFLVFTLASSFPYFTTPNKCLAFFRSLQKKPALFVGFALLALLAVAYNSHEHPYLLADNRHYSFYVWRKIFHGHYLLQYLLIPVYVYAGWSLLQAFHSKDIIWKASLLLSIVLSSVPQKLLEFRYFIIPYVIIRLNMPLDLTPKLLTECTTYFATNLFTIYMFVFRPFFWEDSQNPQRFMW